MLNFKGSALNPALGPRACSAPLWEPGIGFPRQAAGHKLGIAFHFHQSFDPFFPGRMDVEKVHAL